MFLFAVFGLSCTHFSIIKQEFADLKTKDYLGSERKDIYIFDDKLKLFDLSDTKVICTRHPKLFEASKKN